MDSVLDKPIVLKLNRLWQRIGWSTPRQAFTAMVGGEYGGTPPFQALSITADENGELIEGIALNWDDWIKLPIRPCDFAISTGRGEIRVPSVRRRVLTGKAIRERDGHRCQVSGRILKEGDGNMGHIVARAKGGARSWENLVYMDKRLNTLQGTHTPEEMGWTLLGKPIEPPAVPASYLITEPKHDSHTPFIKG